MCLVMGEQGFSKIKDEKKLASVESKVIAFESLLGVQIEGGVIDFQTQVKVRMSDNGVLNVVGRLLASWRNRLWRLKRLKKVIAEYNRSRPEGASEIKRYYFKGNLYGGRLSRKGISFTGQICSLTVPGLSGSPLSELAALICRAYGQNAVYVNDSTLNETYFVNGLNQRVG